MKYKSSFEEVWEARRQIFNLCHRDPKELIEYYITLQDNNKIKTDSINILSDLINDLTTCAID